MSGLHQRKTDHGIKDYDAVVTAIRAIKEDNVAIRAASKSYKIPYGSLHRYVEKVTNAFPNISETTDLELKEFLMEFGSYRHPQVFDRQQENALMQYVLKCSDIYFGLSRYELKKLAFNFAMKIHAEVPDSWNEARQAGNTWFYGFLRRHKNLSMRKPEALSIARATAFNRDNVKLFFQNYGSIREKVKSISQIWNMDETGFTTVAKANRVVSRKGVKRTSFLTSQERGSLVTMALAVSASGNKIPPFFVFPRTNFRASFLDNASSGAVGVANPSGWMNQDSFVKFIDHFIQHTHCSKENPVILLIDNHDSHLSIEALDKAVDFGIHIVSFPPHTSHKLQPLDVSVFAPLKNLFNTQCNNWMKEHAGRAMEIQHIPQILATVLGSLTEQTITSGFRATGICPFNPDIFTEADYVASDLSREFAINEEQIDEEHERLITVDSASTSAASIRDVLHEVGPVKPAGKKEKSKRGRKPMQSLVLTSPETMKQLRAAAEKRASKQGKSTQPSKRKADAGASTSGVSTISQQKRIPQDDDSSSEEEDEEFCTICMKAMPKVINNLNSRKCQDCGRDFHKKCATYSGVIFRCIHCRDSDESHSSDEN